MRNRMQFLRRISQALISFAILLSIAIAANPEPAQTENESDNSAAKPLTARLDPRKSVTPGKTEPKTEKQLAEERKAHEAARKRGEIIFDDLKFDIEKGAKFAPVMITKELMELDKKIFKLRGFILPATVFQQTGIKEFVLVRDNQQCCFGPGAAIYDCVMVEMNPGKTTNFSTRVVTVKGKLEIDIEKYKDEEGANYAMYRMTAEEVK